MLNGRGAVRLETMLGVLSAIVELSQLRLHGGTRPLIDSSTFEEDGPTVGKLDETIELAALLAALARREIAALEAQRPNDPLAVEQNARFVDVLRTLADGFEQIARSLTAYAKAPHQISPPSQAIGLAQVLGQKLTGWLKKHGEELAGSGAKLSLMTAGVAALNVCGADMKIATGLVGVAVLGPDAVSAVKGTIGRRRRKE